jgi:hypothetical protein
MLIQDVEPFSYGAADEGDKLHAIRGSAPLTT